MATDLTKTKVGDQVIARVENLTKAGFTMPRDYNPVNAIKASMLVLQELEDKNHKPALEVCTQNSIASALFEMATKGLDVSKKTAFFIIRGTKLCLHESYFGKALQVKRIYPNYEPHPVVVHEGDEFVYTIDPETGYKKLVKHEQKLENLDKDFVGAYMYIPTADGKQDLYIMTKKQILTAWSKSSSTQQLTHKQFTEKMASKTIVNSGLNMVINSTPDLSYASNEDEKGEEYNERQLNDHSVTDYVEAEDVTEVPDGVDPDTGEIKPEPTQEPQPEPQKEEEEF